MFAYGTTTLIISNEEMNDIIKIVKSLEKSGLLIKGVRKSIKNEAKEQKGRFLSMLLGTLGVSLMGNLLAGKWGIRAGEGTIRGGQDFRILHNHLIYKRPTEIIYDLLSVFANKI